MPKLSTISVASRRHEGTETVSFLSENHAGVVGVYQRASEVRYYDSQRNCPLE